MSTSTQSWIDRIDSRRAAERIRGVLRRTPLWPFPSGDPRIELRLKPECLQLTGSFKARGAWNNVSQLDAEQRKHGVVATSSGNHGQALAWAAQRGGVKATIFMPQEVYPNKIAACRQFEAEVVLCENRVAAEAACAEAVAAGATLVHPYDAEGTIEGAGTVGLEIAEDWPEVDLVVIQVGGGGMIAGSSLAIRRALGDRTRVLGVEPVGAPNLERALAAGEPVMLERITTAVQGLCPLNAGARNLEVCQQLVDRVVLLEDAGIHAAQGRLVREARLVVEPAGAAATAAVLQGHIPTSYLDGRTADNPLKVVAVVSGGNPAPDQLASVVQAEA